MSFLDKLNSPLVVAVVLVVLLILDGFLFYRYQQSLQSTRNLAIDAQAEEIGKEATASPEETAKETTNFPEEQNGVRVVVSVVNTPVGLSIQEDGKLVHDQVNNPGFYEEFEAEESIILAAADGGAVQAGVDGENLEPLGESGEAVTRTFTNESEGQ